MCYKEPMAISRMIRTDETKAETDETYTPPWLFDQLGIHFDLDVAAPTHPINWTIPATHKYTKQDDALTQPWFGKVWMNPPYSKPTPWIERFINHNNGIALLPYTRAKWFMQLWESDAAICNLQNQNGKLFTFIKADGRNQGIFMPVALFALGHECKQALHNINSKVR